MHDASQPAVPEIWGGIECTINRVGDHFFDQLAWSGHYDRIDDLNQIADLGIKTLRYPVLWEHVAPNGLASADWSSVDLFLARIRELGINPIVTLVHHGSGPSSTNLLDAGFAPGLAEFAGVVARRYPWIRDYTPVNEPLTTARFSGLYGHWYPHRREMPAFLRCLVNEIAATSRAMAAIRAVRPDVRLIQTEDIGKTHSTPLLRYQAEHENQRRWLSFDLLCGRVERFHPLWDLLRDSGIAEQELDEFVASPCPPDVFGINYYVTSERFIDERLNLYPAHVHGGNGIHAYADVEALRAGGAGTIGFREVLREATERYGGPIAVTEVHLGAARDDQVRWLIESWEAVRALRADGCDVRALTVWSLLGSHNWINLVTQDVGHYEPGVFDIRGGVLRPTALAHVVRELARTGSFVHPLLDSPGWWRRDDRYLFGELPASRVAPAPPRTNPIMLVPFRKDLTLPFERRLQERGLASRTVAPGELERYEAQASTPVPWAFIFVAPELTSRVRHLVELVSERHPTIPCLVNARDHASLSDRRPLVTYVAGGRTVLDGASPRTIDEMIDLLIDRAAGCWAVTDDGELRPSAVPFASPPDAREAAFINAQSALDGSASI